MTNHRTQLILQYLPVPATFEHVRSKDYRASKAVRSSQYNTIQYNTMENLHSKTDKHTVSLI